MKKPTKRSRTRSGCLTCRDRHMKCDEQLPVCQNCIKSQRKCYRGIRLNFTQYSFYDPGDHFTPTLAPRVLDQSITIANLYQDSSSYRKYLKLHSIQDLRESDEVFRNDCEVGFGSMTTPTDEVADDQSSHPLYWQGGVTNINSKQNASGQRERHDSRSSTSLGPSQLVSGVPVTSLVPQATYDRASVGSMSNMPIVQSQSMLSLDMTSIQPPFYSPMDSLLSSASSFNQDLIKNFSVSDTFNPNVNVQHFLSSNRLNQNPNLTFSSSTIPIDNPEFEFDVFQFICLVQSEQYYWLLDLLNELDVWKSIVPSYCINLVNNKEEIDIIDNKFIINCLLTARASDFDPDDMSTLISLQNRYFNLIRSTDINLDTFAIYEILLLSIVLLLLHLLNSLTLNKPIENSNFFIGNQLILYNKIAYKFHKISSAASKRCTSVILISCFHSIVMLKFLIQRYIGLGSHERGDIETKEWVEDFREPITKDIVPEIPDLRLNFFEVVQLSSHFQRYDYPQVNLAQDPRATSNAYRLRRLMWDTIMAEYGKSQSTLQFTIDPDIVKFDIPQEYVILTNDRLGLIVMLSNYLNCTPSFPIDAISNYESRGKWKQYFSWLFN